MLDVHAPEHGIHGMRDFFVHLLTITAGLLIALALEAGVEAVHHRHQRREAEDNLRQELRDNARDLKKVLGSAAKEREVLTSVLVLAQARSEGKDVPAENVSLGSSFATLHEASWDTASATGVLNYMDYTEVQRFAETYQLQREYVSVQESMLQDYLQAISHVTGTVGLLNIKAMTPSEAGAAMVDLQHTLARLAAMQEIGQLVGKDYDAAIAQH